MICSGHPEEPSKWCRVCHLGLTEAMDEMVGLNLISEDEVDLMSFEEKVDFFDKNYPKYIDLYD